ncbi:hypothetical protein ACHAQJ_005386 [Trichoderma viride]
MDPIEFWSSQAVPPKPSTPAPPAVSRRFGSVDRDDPLLSTSPSQVNAAEKNELRQSRIAVVLSPPAYLQQSSRSQVDGKGQGGYKPGPSQQGTSSLASRVQKETPVPLPRQLIRTPVPAPTPVPLPKPLARPLTPAVALPAPKPKPARPLTLATAAVASPKPAPKPTPVPLPKHLIKPSLPATRPVPTPSPATGPASQPSAGRGRPKGWRPGMSYSSLRGPNSAGKPVRQAKPKSLPLGYAKRRGRPPKAPSPLPWQVYQSVKKSFAAFLCEWGGCIAELHNLDTLRRHVLVVHCRKQPFVCRWGKCAQRATFDTFPDEPSLRAHIEKAHLIPFSWHVGDGPQNTDSPKPPLEDEEIPDYLQDEQGNQVTPSIRNQEIEDFVTWKNNRQKLKDLLVRMNENLPSEESDSSIDEA